MAAKHYAKTLAAAGMATVLAGEAYAQIAPTREEVRREGLSPQIDRTGERVSVEGGVERAPCPLAQPRFADITFQLNGVVFNNLTAIPADSLTSSYSDFVGQTVPIARVCDIRDRAATLIRDQGYLAAVQVPPQQIGDDGIVRFDVLMAQMERVQVRGDTGNSERIVEGYLQPLTEMEAFNQRAAERYLLLARRLPGYDTRLTLRPAGGEPGAVIGDVQIQHTKFSLEGNLQNYGPTSAGRFGGQVRAQVNDVLGIGDRTIFGVYSTVDFQESQVVTFAHDFAAGSSGLRLGGEFTYAWNDPTIGGNNPFNTETLIATGRASYPFVLDQGTQIGGSLGFEFIDQHVDFGNTRINEDNLRVAFARMDAVFTDRRSIEGYRGFSVAEPRWRFGISTELRQGVDIFGASERSTIGIVPLTPPQTRPAGKSTATLLRVEGLAELRPSPNVAFVLEPRLQLTTDPLLAYEEFSGGNYTVGRGYDPGSVIGDNGFGFRYEIRAGSLVPRTRNDLAVQPYAFFDAAWIDNEDPAAFAAVDSDELYSTGAGVRFSWGNRFRLDTALAVPLRRTALQASTPDPRLLISLTVRFAR